MKYTIKNFREDFGTEEKCLNYIFYAKFSKKYVCPSCKKQAGFYKVSGRKCYACAACGQQIHPLAGTIFHKSPTPLTLWFYAIYLFSASKNGVSAKELERHLGCTYKTAWRVGKQIRALMEQKGGMLSGIVEADETYIGGTRKLKHNKMQNKTAVVGVVERQGEARVRKLEDMSRYSIMGYVKQNVVSGSRLMTDEAQAYYKAKKDFRHKSVKHSANEYVRGKIHTNTVEGLWSQIKRSIDGTYHSVSPKYLQDYLDEFSFRYNHRSSASPIFSLLLSRV
ncbi:MAG: IS1595 family transposase [Patescibacteria group bacterium]